jgi:hypothetical protein
MIILICCITILLTYILIFCLITYYFIKYREILNDLFNINNIIDTLIEIFVCPEHFIIYIPGIVDDNTSCIEKIKLKHENKEKIRRILTKINSIFKKMENIGLEDDSICNNTNYTDNINNITQIKWVLEGTMDNFTHMYSETADFYNKLSGSYNILNGNSNTNLEKDKVEANKNNLITLEKLVIIENNIEYCDSILQLLKLIDNKDYETLFQIENNNYILCLLYNLIKSVRSYKIRMYKIINL